MRRLLGILVVSVAMCGFAAPAALAFDLQELDVTFETEWGGETLQAGSHPFAMSTTFGVGTVPAPEAKIVPDAEIRNLTISQVPGFVGSQAAVPRCDQADFNDRFESRPSCPGESAVGYAAVEAEYDPISPAQSGTFFHVPVYSLDPPPGVAAQLGFVVLNVPLKIDIRVSDQAPNNLFARLTNISQAVLLYRSKVVLWGNPASEAHDDLRGDCLGEVAFATSGPVSEGSCPVDLPDRAFLTLPRSCGDPLATVFDAVSWAGLSGTGTATTHKGVTESGVEECETLDFDAGVSATASATSASSPSGLQFGLNVDDPGLTDPSERAKSDVRGVVARLPLGMTLNPSAANGLEACSPAQYEAEGPIWEPGVGCPQASKLGTAQVSSPLLDETLTGQVFVAEQGNNPFGSLFALYLVIRSERYGVLIKQAGKVEPDPVAGQLTTTFSEVPQLPFAELNVRLREGPRAPLVTPEGCGAHTLRATLTPWSGSAPIVRTASVPVTSGPGGSACPGPGPQPFTPGFAAGTATNKAGSYSPLAMRITRADGEQEITRFDAVLPPGVVGKIAGLGRCGDAELAAAKGRSGRQELASPSCPESSRIGRVLAGAGAGSQLTYVEGTIYLAGPYGGAPLSVAVVTPAVAGPFDLGTVVIREGLDLDPNTAQVHVDGALSDPIPHILEGVPLRLRDLRIQIDRSQFTLNATSCEPKQVAATVFGSALDPLSAADDAPVGTTDHYQAAGCGKLKFKPRLSLRLKGGTKRNSHPSLRSALTFPYRSGPGYSNVSRAVVTLPPSLMIDNAHVENPCTRDQFAEEACPKGSVLGTATASTPLLDEPLKGKVYFRSNGGARLLPDIVADLRGQFRIILVGFVDAKSGRIRTTFANVPDAPVKQFQLSLFGGKRGLLVNNRNLCKSSQRANIRFVAQNGFPTSTKPLVKTSCKRKKR